ncbi:MAG: Gfo/Idh/MocA family oxidoreductase [Planctomycetes bacterium]|jgi:predicted dehydrogenase|nr:Gfo/Idh/MocA family oxidoreductase [Planctomycetota bacterium]
MSSQTNTISGTNTGAGAVATAAVLGQMAYAQGSDKIKVGMLGCGGRGRGAMQNCLDADPAVEIIALADLFESQIKAAHDTLLKRATNQGRVKVNADHMYSGFDCHEKLAQCEADLLLMATAPAFRGRQLMAAIKAGKNVFTEKPIATDVAGCKEVMEASKLAKEKGLAIAAGTQRRHQGSYVETMKRIHDGAIGELVGGQCYWYGGGIWFKGVSGDMNELQWQCHNWYHFTWLSGDQICEQHIHNIDVMNWCFNGPPAKLTALGGRQWRDSNAEQVRTAKDVCKKFNNGSEAGWEKYNGDIWDHIYAEFEYPNGARCLSFSGHSPGTSRVSERIVGTKGTSNCSGSISGQNAWRYEGKDIDPMVQEHKDLIASIRSGKPLNEGQRVAESTLTAIGTRIAANTGQVITWDWLMNESKQRLVPTHEEILAGKPLYHPISTGRDAKV